MHIPKNKDILAYLQQSTMYEVNLRQYTPEGTIRAFQSHLPRLQQMGVNVLWFMPVHPIGIQNRKGSLGSYYSVKDYTDINPEYGTREDFKHLVTQAHALGMKVIIDWVANHAAWDNVWTSTHPEYFKRDEQGQFLSPYDWTDVIQIDHANETAHQALRDAMCYWVKEFDIDGFRADLAHLTPLPFWVKAREQCAQIKAGLIWLAETEDVHYFDAFDVAYAWKWMHRTEKMIKEQRPVQSMIEVLHEQKHAYPENALELFFTTNHDENSWNGTEKEKYGIYCDALTAFCFVYPWSVPLIYSGQEISNNKRLAFFDKDALHWPFDLEKEKLYTRLSAFRKVMRCTHELHFQHAGEKILSMVRGTEEKIWLLINFDEKEIQIDAEFFPLAVPCGDVMSGEVVKAKSSLVLKPGEWRMFVSQVKEG